jgi:hypothetical protein
MRLWPLVLLLLIALGGGAFLLKDPGPVQPSTVSPAASSERNYTGTGLVQRIEALQNGACRVGLKLHQWTSLSPGFSLAEMPRAGQFYTVEASPEHCLAIQVALSEGLQGESVKGHIYYTAAEGKNGSWYFMTPPKAPVGCGVM